MQKVCACKKRKPNLGFLFAFLYSADLFGGGLFEFGFADAMLQMWVSYMMEFEGKEVTFGCVRPEETAKSHALITAALESGREHRTVEIEY